MRNEITMRLKVNYVDGNFKFGGRVVRLGRDS